MVERIGEDGERRECRPDEVARLDQLTKLHDDTSHRLVELREQVAAAVQAGDMEAAGQATKALSATVKGLWPRATQDTIDFIMYLLGLLESAKEMEYQRQEVAETIVHATTLLLRPDHPIHRVPGLDLKSIIAHTNAQAERYRQEMYEPQLRIDQMVDPDHEGLDPDSQGQFICGDGTLIERVHPANMCRGPFCPIHRPAPGPWDSWPTTWIDEASTMGRLCPHGQAHVAIEDILTHVHGVFFEHIHVEGCDCPCDLSRVQPIFNDENQMIGFRPNADPE